MRSDLNSVLKSQDFYFILFFFLKCWKRSRFDLWRRTSKSAPGRAVTVVQSCRIGAGRAEQGTGNGLHKQPKEGDELGAGAQDWRQVHLQHRLDKDSRHRPELEGSPWTSGQKVAVFRSKVRLVRAILDHQCTQDHDRVLWISELLPNSYSWYPSCLAPFLCSVGGALKAVNFGTTFLWDVINREWTKSRFLVSFLWRCRD